MHDIDSNKKIYGKQWSHGNANKPGSGFLIGWDPDLFEKDNSIKNTINTRTSFELNLKTQ